MIIGDRLRAFREEKKLSQGDIEKRTGLFRCYTLRVENGYTVPTVETLEKYARALEIPLYRLFYDREKPPEKPTLPATKSEALWGTKGNERDELRKFAKLLSQMDDQQRTLLFGVAQHMARRNRP
jgi:transcriptional regulator with XRE-family HTH domain